jgi:hypothetical protein
LAVVTGQYLLEGTAADTSGFGRDGTLAGSPTFTTGIYKNSNSALLLNTNGPNMPNQAAAQSVVLPADTDFIRNAPGATLLAWVRLDGGTSNRTVISVNNADTAAGGGQGGSRATLQVIDGGDNDHQIRVGGRVADGGGFTTAISGTTAVPIGETVFLAGVFDFTGNAIRAYMNGQLVGENINPGWSTNSADTANFFAEIGSVSTPSAANQEFWPGVIDGARIFNTAMSTGDIFNIYAAEALAPLLPGDTNGNGIPGESQDLTPIRTHYRQMVTSRIDGDLTGDLFVDFRDFREWKIAFLNAGSGSLAGLDLSFLTVPEPAAIWLAVMGIVGIGAVGCRRRRFCRTVG